MAPEDPNVTAILHVITSYSIHYTKLYDAKWAMLMTGNYRCITKQGMRSINEAVHSDIDASRAMYAWVVALCQSLGARESDLVPFEKYAAAAKGLTGASSAARALYGLGGAQQAVVCRAGGWGAGLRGLGGAGSGDGDGVWNGEQSTHC